jgi:hypothetical protein
MAFFFGEFCAKDIVLEATADPRQVGFNCKFVFFTAADGRVSA